MSQFKPIEILSLYKTICDLVQTGCANKYIIARANNLTNFYIMSDNEIIKIEEFLKSPIQLIKDITSNLKSTYELTAWQYIIGALSDTDSKNIIFHYTKVVPSRVQFPVESKSSKSV